MIGRIVRRRKFRLRQRGRLFGQDGQTGLIFLALPLPPLLYLLVFLSWEDLSKELLLDEPWPLARVTSSIISVITAIGTLILMGWGVIQVWRHQLTVLLGNPRGGIIWSASRLVGRFLAYFATGIWLAYLMSITSETEHGALLRGLVLLPAGIALFGTVFFIAPAFAAFIAVGAWSLSIFAYSLVVTLRWLANRIVEHPKGAWDAILLLATVALGIAFLGIQFQIF